MFHSNKILPIFIRKKKKKKEKSKINITKFLFLFFKFFWNKIETYVQTNKKPIQLIPAANKLQNTET